MLLISVATAPTVYGIETSIRSAEKFCMDASLQQHLPFTVLKRGLAISKFFTTSVATAPTVYGIETYSYHQL